MDRAGLVGDDGPTHHGAFDISYLSLMPNMVLLAPRDTTELREMTQFLHGYNAGPSAVRYPRGASDERLPESRSPIQMGRSEVLRHGKHVTLAAVGSMVGEAYEAARLLAENGIEATVINARWLKPIDIDAIAASLETTKHLVTIEENVRIGGYGQQVRDELGERGIQVPMKVIALPDGFVEHGAQPLIRRDVGLCADGIVESVMQFLKVAKK